MMRALSGRFVGIVDMAQIQIFVGSIYGASEQVAEIVSEQLTAAGHSVATNAYPRPQDLTNPDEIILLCHSNTGSGELPDGLQPLYLHLTRDLPRISQKRYGVINLADSSYTTFNEAGIALDHAFSELGAQRLGEPLVIDAMTGENPAQLATQWLKRWMTYLP